MIQVNPHRSRHQQSQSHGDEILPAQRHELIRAETHWRIDLRGEREAFGLGVHFCIGAPLSRLESVIALEKIVERWNTIEVTNAQGDPAEWPLRYEPSFVLRGLESLHMRITC